MADINLKHIVSQLSGSDGTALDTLSTEAKEIQKIVSGRTADFTIGGSIGAQSITYDKFDAIVPITPVTTEGDFDHSAFPSEFNGLFNNSNALTDMLSYTINWFLNLWLPTEVLSYLSYTNEGYIIDYNSSRVLFAFRLGSYTSSSFSVQFDVKKESVYGLGDWDLLTGNPCTIGSFNWDSDTNKFSISINTFRFRTCENVMYVYCVNNFHSVFYRQVTEDENSWCLDVGVNSYGYVSVGYSHGNIYHDVVVSKEKGRLFPLIDLQADGKLHAGCLLYFGASSIYPTASFSEAPYWLRYIKGTDLYVMPLSNLYGNTYYIVCNNIIECL